MALRYAKLTKASIKALTSGNCITEHGIRVDRTSSGDLRWSVNVMVDGERIHRVIGKESEGVTREQAERAIEMLRTKAREDRLDLPSGRKAHRTFAEAADEYIARLTASGGKNLAIKRRHVATNLKPALGRERLDKLNEFGLQRYRRNRRAAGVGDATINREMATLSHLLRSAVAWRWMKADAMPGIPKTREAVQPIAVLSDQQATALMDGAMKDQDARLWLFVAFGLNAAMRHREILSVRYDQIDFEHHRIVIPQAKAGQREQPITKVLADALARQRKMEKDKDGWVFPAIVAARASKGHRTNMARPFLRAVMRAGLDPHKVTPHTMRHTAITRLVKAGVDLPTIQRISGHKTLAMVLRYTHVHGQHIDAAINRLSTVIPEPISRELHAQLPQRQQVRA